MGQSAWVVAAIEGQLNQGIRDTPAARDLREASVNLRQAVAALQDLDLRIAREVKRALQTVAATESGMAAPTDQQRRPAGKANRS